VLQPFRETASGGRQSTSLEGDLCESGTLLVITDSPHIRTPMLPRTAGVIYTRLWWTGRRKDMIGPKTYLRILEQMTVD
jgi:hypothetical protein